MSSDFELPPRNSQASALAGPAPLKPGLLVLHGNRLETLAEAVFEWQARHPLAPLELDPVLVQSNGMAEWFKMSQASFQGVCAATQVELPARFLWRVYRSVLGHHAVPPVSAVDKQPLVWRLMSLLPRWIQAHAGDPVWSALGSALGSEASRADAALSAERSLVLCQRLADLFDQYQIYRPDWLDDWAAGRDVLRGALFGRQDGRQPSPVPVHQAWQPALWRAIVESLSAAEQGAMRPAVHRRCVQALEQALQDSASAAFGRPAWALPRRVVLFGSTQLPQSTLELLAALSRHVQIILAVPNPCRYFWADLIDGREQLAIARRRHPLRAGVELAALPLQALHAHGHPLLAAWGRQARDFVRQLDAFDDVQRSREQFELPKVDLFDEEPGGDLLQQVQARIRDGVPMHEHADEKPKADDRSISFHVAHSAHREVEILHDQLLHLLAHPPAGKPLSPRDIVVMVPEIDRFAASIRAVFGQHPRGSARHIPWGIADVSERCHSPLLQAVEWLLRAPQHRFSASEWRDLLELPACARRFGIDAEALPQAMDWLAGAGVRWGLGAAQRADLGLGATGETASWHFAVQRMLLGYAAGDLDDGFNGIEPYTEVAGLAATLAGALASMAREVDSWWLASKTLRSPQDWAPLLRGLLARFFEPQDEIDRAALAALDAGLNSWLQACDASGFEDPVPLPVVREAWLGSLQEPALKQRFKAGGVTFCTLLPLRAIPFDVVCLLGMNEGDYPRVAPAADFDLMALPGQGRPGDRSRRHDDRQLMLDALLSARRVLHISWVGRSQRDNTAQPPSVLVTQLRDYLDAGWGSGTCATRTVEHPLQAFSRRYFERAASGADPRLFTYASEWRQAHTPPQTDAKPQTLAVPAEAALQAEGLAVLTLTLAQLVALLRAPVRFYCRHHLKLVFGDDGQADLQDDESFDDSALERSQWLMRVLQAAPQHTVDQSLRRLAREACLPLASAGLVAQAQLREQALPMLAERERILKVHPKPAVPVNIELCSADAGVRLVDCVQGLWQDDSGEMLAGVNFAASALKNKGKSRTDRLLSVWVQALACAAAGQAVQWHLIGPDHIAVLAPLQAQQATQVLQALLQAASSALLDGRLPASAARTGIAWMESLDGPKASEQAARREAKKAFEGDEFGRWGEAQDACLQRMYPSFERLIESPHFESDTRLLYGPLLAHLPGVLQWEALPNAPVESAQTEAVRPSENRDD